jgi:hypothetical protein
LEIKKIIYKWNGEINKEADVVYVKNKFVKIEKVGVIVTICPELLKIRRLLWRIICAGMKATFTGMSLLLELFRMGDGYANRFP